MSQLTFDGFPASPDEKSRPRGTSPSTPEEKIVLPESWYKGRVLSHSSIGLYKTCPQRWKLRYIDKVPEKPRSFFSFGKSVHTGLEFLFEKIGSPLPTLDETLAHYKEHWLREGYETAAQEKWFFQEGERILKGFYAKHETSGKNVFQVEYKFTFQLEGVPITGFIDRIDLTPKGGLSLIDYKTGKAFDKSRVRVDQQLTMYQIAAQEIFKKPVESVTLYHLNSLTPLTVPAHSKTQEDKLREEVVEAAKGISDQKFEPKPDERGHCQWCDYVQICPAFSGKKLPVVPKSPGLADLADRYGKLDAKIKEMSAERDGLGEEIKSSLRVTGERQAQGKYFTVDLSPADDAPPSISVAPNSTEKPA